MRTVIFTLCVVKSPNQLHANYGKYPVKFLCLAYGDEEGWNSPTPDQQAEALDQDAVIQRAGNPLSTVKPKVTTVRNRDESLQVTDRPVIRGGLPS